MDNKEFRNEQGLTESEFIKNYDPNKYDRPSVTNDLLIFTLGDREEGSNSPHKKLQILLIQRRDHPSIHKWALPGGFLNMDEDLIQGAYRELEEETGVTDIYVEQLGAFGEMYIDKERTIPRDPRTRIITVGNIALIPKDKLRPEAGDDAENVMWFNVETEFLGKKVYEEYFTKTNILHLTSEDKKTKISYKVEEKISNDAMRKKEVSYSLVDNSTDSLAADHFKLIFCGLNRIRKKIEYTPVALNFLPRTFTRKALTQVYEAILGRKIENLECKVGDMVVKVKECENNTVSSSEQLYELNVNWEHEL